MSDQVYDFFCRNRDCEEAFSGTVKQMALQEWFWPRGAAPRYAYCRSHVPAWVPEWRERKRKNKAEAQHRQRQVERDEQANEVQELADRWVLKASWPTAWDEDALTFELATEKAFEYGGGTCGGGVMTGAPLYLSPSNLTAVFDSEAGALAFVSWLKAWLAPRRGPHCDERLYKLELERRQRYAI